MKATLILLLLVLIMGCEKDDTESNVSECVLRMKTLFDKDLMCQKEGQFASSVNLYRGEYDGKIVYYVLTTGCPTCLVAPPNFGYTCSEEKIMFEDFRIMKDTKQIYSSCTKKYNE